MIGGDDDHFGSKILEKKNTGIELGQFDFLSQSHVQSQKSSRGYGKVDGADIDEEGGSEEEGGGFDYYQREPSKGAGSRRWWPVFAAAVLLAATGGIIWSSNKERPEEDKVAAAGIIVTATPVVGNDEAEAAPLYPATPAPTAIPAQAPPLRTMTPTIFCADYDQFVVKATEHTCAYYAEMKEGDCDRLFCPNCPLAHHCDRACGLCPDGGGGLRPPFWVQQGVPVSASTPATPLPLSDPTAEPVSAATSPTTIPTIFCSDDDVKVAKATEHTCSYFAEMAEGHCANVFCEDCPYAHFCDRACGLCPEAHGRLRPAFWEGGRVPSPAPGPALAPTAGPIDAFGAMLMGMMRGGGCPGAVGCPHPPTGLRTAFWEGGGVPSPAPGPALAPTAGPIDAFGAMLLAMMRGGWCGVLSPAPGPALTPTAGPIGAFGAMLLAMMFEEGKGPG